jgi:hypothetical protein
VQRTIDLHSQTLPTVFDEEVLEDVLLQHLSRCLGASVELGTRVESFKQAPEHVEVWLHEGLDLAAQEETACAQYLMACAAPFVPYPILA